MSKKYFSFNKNVRNVLAISLVATAFVFSLGTGQAFADNHEVSTASQLETVQQDQTVDATTDSTIEPSKEDGATESTDEIITEELTEEESDVNSEVEENHSSLLPGDFFYFVKKLMENVQLALTFDEVKEAELLAAFTEERIKEAEALLVQGEEELANEVLQKAIEQQELALVKYEQSQTSEEAEPNNEETTEVDDVAQ
jgi:hypothetical protein